MAPALLLPMLVSLFTVGPTLGTELQYAGKLRQVARNGDSTVVKTFALTAIVVRGEAERPTVAWVIDERGEGWPWPHRFGEWTAGSADAKLPSVLHEHGEIKSAVALRLPVFEHRHQLAENAEWTEGRVEFRVLRRKMVQDRDCWEVAVSGTRGHDERLMIDAATGILVSGKQRLFLGQGDEFELTLDLEQQRTLSDESFAATSTTAAGLTALNQKIGREEASDDPLLSAEQVEAAKALLPELQKASAGTSLESLVTVMTRDVQQQARRLEGLEGLTRRFVGQSVGVAPQRLISGAELAPEALRGQVTVLHFWTYNGDQLKEPFGQVGYLDFLNGKRKRIGVKVVGVAVDPRFGDPAQASAATRRVKKLLQFMNLGYDVIADDGKLLKQFGDPPSLGAPLPLWIVVGHDGKIVHYHSGHYDINPDRGLEQLDAAVIEAVRQRPTGADSKDSK
ncbi:MAG: TlpA family protein disulfide reductase [Planctomycetaceae bacterium]|nr:TlpA family protein disulfide reductase [Planctomycetaceae bacterium]